MPNRTVLILCQQKNPKGAAEFAWNIMDFKEDQDVRIKVGYEMFEKVPLS